jgi:hypothetical protein
MPDHLEARCLGPFAAVIRSASGLAAVEAVTIHDLDGSHNDFFFNTASYSFTT